MGKLEMEMQRLERGCVWLNLFSFIVAVILIAASIYSLDGCMQREQAYRQEIRAERCEKMGENIPVEMQAYCEGLGV